METNYKRVQAYTVARELAEQKLAGGGGEAPGRAEHELTSVLQYQRDLANARISELRAIVDYNLSLASLDKALGSSLKNKNMTIADFALAK